MRRRPPSDGQSGHDLLETEVYLDEDEQEKVVSGFELQLSRSTVIWKSVFGVVSLVLGMFFLVTGTRQVLTPWEIRITGEFRTVTSSGPLVAVLLLQAWGLFLLGVGLIASRGIPGSTKWLRRALAVAHTSGVVGACYWLSAMTRKAQRYGRHHFDWEFLWLPLGPIAYSLVCQNVVHSLSTTNKEVQELRGSMYRLKKV